MAIFKGFAVPTVSPPSRMLYYVAVQDLELHFMVNTKELWDTRFAEGLVFIPISDKDLDFILERSEHPKIALDIACGSGDLVVKLARRGITTTGADISSVGLHMARESLVAAGLDAKLIEADFDSPDLSSQLAGAYDIIFMRCAFAFVKDRHTFFQEVRKILRPGGVFVCILNGLLPDGVYDERELRISLPKDELELALKEPFPSVELLIVDTVVKSDWPLLTYVCRQEKTI